MGYRVQEAVWPEEVLQREDMLEKLRVVEIQEGHDRTRWCFEKSGQYTTKSMYRFLAHRGVINCRMQRLWKTNLPLKLKLFMWQVFQDRLQTGGELKKRNWKGMRNALFAG
jgi:hypothetical protein